MKYFVYYVKLKDFSKVVLKYYPTQKIHKVQIESPFTLTMNNIEDVVWLVNKDALFIVPPVIIKLPDYGANRLAKIPDTATPVVVVTLAGPSRKIIFVIFIKIT